MERDEANEMSDLISRSDALDIVLEYAKRLYRHIGTPEDNEMYSFGRGLVLSIERNLKGLPSAQPNLQSTCNELATDCISRQSAIDAFVNTK